MARRTLELTKIDQLIGNKVYLLRTATGFPREKLADLIGVTYQQLHKYEKGINRISVSRLVLIAKALNKDVSYFYQDLNF